MSAWWTSAFVALWLLVMIIAVILLGYLRRVTAVLERAELAVSSGQVNLGGARVGMQVEPFHVVDDSGREVSSDELFATSATHVILHSSCEPCRHLVGKLERLPDGDAPVFAYMDDTPAGHDIALPPQVVTFFDHDGSVGAAFRSGGTPQAFAVAAGGVIVETLVPASAADLEHLSRRLKEGGDAVAEPSDVVHVP